ncbi:hypothetical protein [Enterococcus phoeniculicola]|jgi:hypothetical protein|uniref:Uncharacterized protein n=1 Tax=Enterococcus phoeniculicola ATCC BAA-412 TaxID=1158610 RepID=R3WEG5_9ENTE|nr:hypothetical protein [Enterococcus phoeniculicola]EOL46271.1 hypothetical protein UC3_01077 [Enterococcus phoeniculicola ATCC BAA-412]EOT76884.1 hypothetical protein I589_01845 [Enterococcus phoeniculicola ATCC BAA-412]
MFDIQENCYVTRGVNEQVTKEIQQRCFQYHLLYHFKKAYIINMTRKPTFVWGYGSILCFGRITKLNKKINLFIARYQKNSERRGSVIVVAFC